MKGCLPEKISWIVNPGARQSSPSKANTSPFNSAAADQARGFHQTLPAFRPTPLVKLNRLACHLGVADIQVKDESYRCGLNAFKILGASYALTCRLAHELDLPPNNLSFNEFQSPGVNRRIKEEFTCITATDGNHGKAVAWATRQL